MNYLRFVGCGLFIGIGLASHAAQYELLKEIPVGGEGGWDYMSVDSAAHRLYVSHSSNVVVIDIANDAVVGMITNTPGVHGVAVAPELRRGFVSDGRANHCSVVDLTTLQTLQTVPTGQNPDGMLYDPAHQEAYMFNGRSHSATVIDGKSGTVVATIPLGGKPEFGADDPQAGRIYDNLEDKSEIAVIDSGRHEMVARWPIAPGESGSGLAIDAARHRLFIGCDNELMVMMDSTDGKVLGTVPIGQGVDATAFDPGTQLAFASCGDGTTTIAMERGSGLMTVQTLKTEPLAKTMALDPATHKIYLGSARFEPAASGQRRRPNVIPGTFKILVYGMR